MATQTLDQKRAKFAWESVQGCEKDYVNLAKGAGALIMSNGLMATLAFYQDKGKDHHRKLQAHIRIWLVKQNLIMAKDFVGFMNALHEADSAKYRQATQEALDLLRWIRHFAAAVVKE